MKKSSSQKLSIVSPMNVNCQNSNTTFNAYYLIHLGIRFNENRDRMKIKTNCDTYIRIMPQMCKSQNIHRKYPSWIKFQTIFFNYEWSLAISECEESLKMGSNGATSKEFRLIPMLEFLGRLHKWVSRVSPFLPTLRKPGWWSQW
jgi:hypothetical protein